MTTHDKQHLIDFIRSIPDSASHNDIFRLVGERFPIVTVADFAEAGKAIAVEHFAEADRLRGEAAESFKKAAELEAGLRDVRRDH